MPGPSSFDQKVYKALDRTDNLGDQFRTWLPRYLRYQSQLQLGKQQIPGVMGEIFRNVGDVGQPAFTSPWRHYQGGGTAFGKVRFYKDYLGIVHIEGLAETTATPTSSLIFTLPAGYRPSQQLLNSTVWNGGSARVDILATGDVRADFGPPYTSYTAGSWLSIANIHFRAG